MEKSLKKSNTVSQKSNVSVILDKIKLSDYAAKYIKLSKKGENHWGLCPFHNEKSPSFVITDSKQSYHCFGCQAHGDLFDLYSHFNNDAPFWDAMLHFANVLGINVSLKSDPNAHIYKILNWANDVYKNSLQKKPPGCFIFS